MVSVTTALLRTYYPRVHTLLEYLASLTASESTNAVNEVLVKPGDPAAYKEFVEGTMIGSAESERSVVVAFSEAMTPIQEVC